MFHTTHEHLKDGTGRVRSRHLVAATLIAAGSLGMPMAHGAGTPSPAEVAAHRQQSLDALLTDEYEPFLIANLRRSCAVGGEPKRVAESRAGGAYFTPDAADGCVTALIRTARDHHLPELYRSFLTELGEGQGGADALPRAIGAAAMGGSTKVTLSAGKAAAISPALALDAGFTVAYQAGEGAKAPSPDPKQLKTVAETCLGQRGDVGSCFSVGYVYGAQAFAGWTAKTL
jgi:hypothetical protein